MAASERGPAWVFGGSGVVGSAVVKELTQRGFECRFSWHHNDRAARSLESACGAHGFHFAAERLAEVDAWVEHSVREWGVPRAFVYAIGVSANKRLAELDIAEFEQAMRVNVTAPFALLHALSPHIEKAGTGLDAVLIGALDRGQSLPLPVHFAASQGALSTLTMSLARELGPLGVRVNQLALGVLEGGLSRTLSDDLVQRYLKFSALRRRGSAEEVARAAAWLLCENTYLTGRVVPVNGGI
ncbi:MAG: SDR family oxidoreductase [Polyangiaceae bacterium]